MGYPLRHVIPAMLLVVGLVAALAVGLTSLRLSHASTEKLVTEFIRTIGNQAAADVDAGLRRSNPTRMRDTIDKLQMLRGLRMAALVDANNEVAFASSSSLEGRTIVDTGNPLFAALIEEARSGRQSLRLDDDSVYYSNYVVSAVPTQFGGKFRDLTLLLEYDLAQAQADQRTAAINQALTIGLTVLALSFACWLFLSNALVSRIAHLASASRRIGDGELRTPITIEGNDEIADLADALDKMRIDLSDKQSDLRLAAEDLEAANAAVVRERELLALRVGERTSELVRANEELGRAKEAAEAASRAKSAFLATVSHEIRTPMNGVLGAMELLERSGLDENRSSLLRTAQQSAGSLLSLLNDLLDMAKIEAGRIEIVEAPASLEAIVDRVIATFAPAAAAGRTRLAGIVDRQAPEWVRTDAMRLQQILGNFVSNALKFADDGSVELRVVAEAGSSPAEGGDCRLVFTVEDDGAGIEAADLEKLFQPFEQGAVEIARRSGGTGLGLAICRGLAGRMGGTVSLDSKPGEGTVATLVLPVAIASAPRSAGQQPPRDGDTSILALLEHNGDDGDESSVRILVVDDHPVNRLLQVRQVEQLGATADTAGDGVSALSKLRLGHFDIVVTDCEMPHMDGYELARAIRDSRTPWSTIPVIACTAHALPDIRARCRQAGMNDVLTKPMRLNDLAAVLRQYWPDSSTPPPAAEPVAPEVLDGASLDLLSGGDPELRDSMMQAFVADFCNALEELEAAVARGDPGTCRDLAHRNRGASAVFGATALEIAFRELEELIAGQPCDAEALQAALRRLRAEGQRLELQLSPGQDYGALSG